MVGGGVSAAGSGCCSAPRRQQSIHAFMHSAAAACEVLQTRRPCVCRRPIGSSNAAAGAASCRPHLRQRSPAAGAAPPAGPPHCHTPACKTPARHQQGVRPLRRAGMLAAWHWQRRGRGRAAAAAKNGSGGGAAAALTGQHQRGVQLVQEPAAGDAVVHQLRVLSVVRLACGASNGGAGRAAEVRQRAAAAARRRRSRTVAGAARHHRRSDASQRTHLPAAAA